MLEYLSLEIYCWNFITRKLPELLDIATSYIVAAGKYRHSQYNYRAAKYSIKTVKLVISKTGSYIQLNREYKA